MRICKDCGSVFKPRSERQYRCDSHEASHRQRTNSQAYLRRKRLGLRAGSTAAHRKFIKAVIEAKGRVCHWCGGVATTADHYPVAKIDGGPDTVENGVPSCEKCNLRRGRGRRRGRSSREAMG